MDLDRFEELLSREAEGTLGEPEREELDGACQADDGLALLRARDQKLQGLLEFEQTGKAPEGLLASVMSEIVAAPPLESDSAEQAESPPQASMQDERVVSIEEVKAPWWSSLFSSRIPQFALGSAIAAVFLFQLAYIATRHSSPVDAGSSANIASGVDAGDADDANYEIASATPSEDATAQETPSDLAATKSPIRQPGDSPPPRSPSQISFPERRASALPGGVGGSGAAGLVRVDNGTSPTNGRAIRVATPAASPPNAALALERVTASSATPGAVIEINLAAVVDGGPTSRTPRNPSLDSPARTGFRNGFNGGTRNRRTRGLRAAIRSLELRLASFGNIRRAPLDPNDPESQTLILSISKSDVPSLLRELEGDGLRPANAQPEPGAAVAPAISAETPLAGGLYRILRGNLQAAATDPEDPSAATEVIEIQFAIRTRR